MWSLINNYNKFRTIMYLELKIIDTRNKWQFQPLLHFNVQRVSLLFEDYYNSALHKLIEVVYKRVFFALSFLFIFLLCYLGMMLRLLETCRLNAYPSNNK